MLYHLATDSQLLSLSKRATFFITWQQIDMLYHLGNRSISFFRKQQIHILYHLATGPHLLSLSNRSKYLTKIAVQIGLGLCEV
uniref:Uncharacterized protein n=1 Tax=Anguilla anguilla TaxID=7936 RepID=A0A0E9RB35_ANGAN